MTNFATQYFERVNAHQQIINTSPAQDLQLIVVVPVYNEPHISATLLSITNNIFNNFSVEIIFVINSSENSPATAKNQNKITINEIKKFFLINKIPNLTTHILEFENLPKKKSGVGVARKLGMDEAVRRFATINNPQGIIVSLDADTTVDKNYLEEIYNHFKNNNETQAANICFEHPTSGTVYQPELYQAITIYELYLRYYSQALRYINYPYYHHTIGSAFCCTADIYTKQGGMVNNKSGEDFYFLQKIIPVSNFSEITTTKVYPSPRITDRVIFGTGVAVKEIIDNYKFEYPTYSFETFMILKIFFQEVITFYKNTPPYKVENQHLQKFLIAQNFDKKILEINNNTTTIKKFINRFYAWFNPFKIVKFLNFCHQKDFDKRKIRSEASYLLSKMDISHKNTASDMLQKYRKLQK